MWGAITPRWLLRLLPWVQVESGTFRVNRAIDKPEAAREVGLEDDLPETIIGYVTHPREYELARLQTTVRIPTTIQDIYNGPYNQIEEQLRLAIESVREEQERLLLQSQVFGLLWNIDPAMRQKPRLGSPIPDDLDDLLVKVWKKPSFFLAHPLAIAAFGREVTMRGVCLGSVEMFGSPFGTWRGVPIIPCDKLPVVNGRSSILLMRVGEDDQGVVGLHQRGIPNEREPSLSIRSQGVDPQGREHWLVSLFFSIAVLTPDALGVLEEVDVTRYGDPRFEKMVGA